MGIDIGLDNLMACVTNTGSAPFVVKGGAVKAANQWFNKRKAYLTGILARGYDSRHSNKDSHALSVLSYQRENFLRDFFYKAAWAVVNRAAKEQIEVIVIGHNEGQKQQVSMGKSTNQNFVSVPYLKLIGAVTTVAAKCGIAVVTREESYTSKASLLDFDPIPTYGRKKRCTCVFREAY